MKLKQLIAPLEQLAPLSFQESYDNAGLITGNFDMEIRSVLITLDVTEEVVDEAIAKGANLILSHHPVIFSGLKRITGNNYVERIVIKAIKNDIALYSAHTNMDSVFGGVNTMICNKLGLQNCKILSPIKKYLYKLVTFVPRNHIEQVRKAVFDAGAGHIGNYDNCSYNAEGKGTFRAGNEANPFVGKIGELHFEDEIRFETIFPKHRQNQIISALLSAHPYEEVAYDIYQLENEYPQAGLGMVGELATPVDEIEFLTNLKEIFQAGIIRHTELRNKKIHRVAVCGGSGSTFLREAISAKADVYVSGDFKYHQFFDAEGKILIADIGHFESEQFTKQLFYALLIKNFPTFAVHLSEIKTNPIKYF